MTSTDFNSLCTSSGHAEKRTVYDQTGTSIQLASPISYGADGAIHETQLQSGDILIKVYNDKKLKKNQKEGGQLSRRIESMLDMPIDDPCLAWPLFAVYETPDARDTIGYGMRKIKGEPFCNFLGKLNLAQTFPAWTRKHLTLTALNFVRIVNKLAKKGILVNDFNPLNFFSDENCQVSLIDCDSFQIPKKGGGAITSNAFFPILSAPELLNGSFGIPSPRNIHMVEFSAAIIVFELLMDGLNPFTCRDPAGRIDTTDLLNNIKKGYCAISKAGYQFPLTCDNYFEQLWNKLPVRMQKCFQDTFCTGHSAPDKRTNLDTFEACLDEMLLSLK